MLNLFTLPSACSLADHIALIWSGLPYQLHVASRDSIKSPEYLTKNPLGQVPLLTEGDWSLTQNAAILSYIAEKAPEANIGADSTAESRAKLASWLSYISSDYHKAFSNIYGATMHGLSNEGAESLKKSAIQGLQDKHLSKMDTYFANHQFVFDNRKTVADAYFWVVTSWAFRFVPDIVTQYPNVSAYFERMKQDEGIQRALKEQTV